MKHLAMAVLNATAKVICSRRSETFSTDWPSHSNNGSRTYAEHDDRASSWLAMST